MDPTEDMAHLFQMRMETHTVSKMFFYVSLQAFAVVQLLSSLWNVAPCHWVTAA